MSLSVVLVVGLGIVALKVASKPATATPNQPKATATLTLQDNTQQVDTSTQENFSSNFTYFSNQNFPISINAASESLEKEAVKQWDTSLSGNSYANDFEQFFSLHPTISGSTSLEQALTFKIRANSLFSKSSASPIARIIRFGHDVRRLH